MHEGAGDERAEMIAHIDGLEQELARVRDALAARERAGDDLLQRLEAAESDLDAMQARHIDERVQDAGEAAVKYRRLEEDTAARAAALEDQVGRA